MLKAAKEGTDLEARTAEEIRRMAALEEEPIRAQVPLGGERTFPSFPSGDVGMWGEASQTSIVSGIAAQSAIPTASQTEFGQKYNEVYGDRAFLTQSRMIGPSLAIRPPPHNRPQSRHRRPRESRRSRSYQHRRSHRRQPGEGKRPRSEKRRSARRPRRRSHPSTHGRRHSHAREGSNRRDRKDSSSDRDEGARAKRSDSNLARTLRKDLMGKHAFQPFSSADFLRTAEIFGHYGYFPWLPFGIWTLASGICFRNRPNVTATDATAFRTYD